MHDQHRRTWNFLKRLPISIELRVVKWVDYWQFLRARQKMYRRNTRKLFGMTLKSLHKCLWHFVTCTWVVLTFWLCATLWRWWQEAKDNLWKLEDWSITSCIVLHISTRTSAISVMIVVVVVVDECPRVILSYSYYLWRKMSHRETEREDTIQHHWNKWNEECLSKHLKNINRFHIPINFISQRDQLKTRNLIVEKQ